MNANAIQIETSIKADLAEVWKFWTKPEHIKKWNNASPDWHTPKAKNELKIGGKFNYRMEAKDGSMGFDFEGIYTDIVPQKLIVYTIADERKVQIKFIEKNNKVIVVEIFEPESVNSLELQRTGWKAILDNFKTYVENIYNS